MADLRFQTQHSHVRDDETKTWRGEVRGLKPDPGAMMLSQTELQGEGIAPISAFHWITSVQCGPIVSQGEMK